MSGFHEILLIAAIILAVLYVPRLTKRREQTAVRMEKRTRPPLSVGMRTAIVVSVVWPPLVVLVARPWEGDWARGVAWALGPVVLLWGLLWIVMGTRNKNQHPDDGN